MGQLQLVRLEVSGVITQKASDTWGLVSCFRDCESYLPPALGGNTIQKRRVVTFGAGHLHEELLLYDPPRMTLAYKLVQDERNLNPFPASFMDYRCTVRLYGSSMEEYTYIRIQCVFRTDTDMVQIMEDAWRQIYNNQITGLQKQLDQILPLAPQACKREVPPHLPLSTFEQQRARARSTSAPKKELVQVGDLGPSTPQGSDRERVSMEVPSNRTSTSSRSSMSFELTRSTPQVQLELNRSTAPGCTAAAMATPELQAPYERAEVALTLHSQFTNGILEPGTVGRAALLMQRDVPQPKVQGQYTSMHLKAGQLSAVPGTRSTGVLPGTVPPTHVERLLQRGPAGPQTDPSPLPTSNFGPGVQQPQARSSPLGRFQSEDAWVAQAHGSAMAGTELALTMSQKWPPQGRLQSEASPQGKRSDRPPLGRSELALALPEVAPALGRQPGDDLRHGRPPLSRSQIEPAAAWRYSTPPLSKHLVEPLSGDRQPQPAEGRPQTDHLMIEAPLVVDSTFLRGGTQPGTAMEGRPQPRLSVDGRQQAMGGRPQPGVGMEGRAQSEWSMEAWLGSTDLARFSDASGPAHKGMVKGMELYSPSSSCSGEAFGIP